MNQIIPIFQIDSNEDSIEISKINDYNISNFGNGFFISNNGYLASVAHVLTDNGLNSFALYNGKLQKIEIIERILTERNENHIDAAIGKLDLDHHTDYFDPLKFEMVALSTNLTLTGYSRGIISDAYNNKYDNTFNCQLIKLQALCPDLKYYYSNNLFPMHNSFTLFLNQTNLGGMSGCPVINESNNVVGVFKGGSRLGNTIKGQAVHIVTFSNMFYKYYNKT